MNRLSKIKGSVVAGSIVVGALVVMPMSASADVVCNRDGDCWHTSQRHTDYPPTLGLQFYGDDWRDAHRSDSHYHWRDDQKDDRGYYDNGKWRTFDDEHGNMDHH